MLVTLRNNYRKRTRVIVDAERRGMPVHVLRANTVGQMERFLGGLFDLSVDRGYGDGNQQIVDQTRHAIEAVLNGERWVELPPAAARIRACSTSWPLRPTWCLIPTVRSPTGECGFSENDSSAESA